MRSLRYTLTRGAEADLDDIHLRSFEQYGHDQTNKYIGELKKAVEFVSSHHAKIPARQHLTGDSGLNLYPVNNLYIVYRPIAGDHVVIISVISQLRDIPTLLIAQEKEFEKDFLEIQKKIKDGEIRLRT